MGFDSDKITSKAARVDIAITTAEGERILCSFAPGPDGVEFTRTREVERQELWELPVSIGLRLAADEITDLEPPPDIGSAVLLPYQALEEVLDLANQGWRRRALARLGEVIPHAEWLRFNRWRRGF